VIGIEGMSAMVRELRTHSYGDQELVRAIAGNRAAPAEVAAFLCRGVVGTTRDYCGQH
jgi:hypothetical protein